MAAGEARLKRNGVGRNDVGLTRASVAGSYGSWSAATLTGEPATLARLKKAWWCEWSAAE